MAYENELTLESLVNINEGDEDFYDEISGFDNEEYVKELLRHSPANIRVSPMNSVLYKTDKTIDETEKLLVTHETMAILREIMKINTLDKKEILDKYGNSFFTSATEFETDDYDIRKNRLEEFGIYKLYKKRLNLISAELEINENLSIKEKRTLKKLENQLQHNIALYEGGLSSDNELEDIKSKLKENVKRFSHGFSESADTFLVPEEDNLYDGHQTLAKKRSFLKNHAGGFYLADLFSVNKDKIKEIVKKVSVILLTAATFGALTGISAAVQAYTQDTYEGAEFRNDMYNNYKNMLTGEGIGEKELQEIQDFVTSHIDIPTDDVQAFKELAQTSYESYKLADKTVTRYSALYPLIQYQDKSNEPNLVSLIKTLEELDQITDEALLCKSNDEVCFQGHLTSEKTKLSELKNLLTSIGVVKEDITKRDLPQYHYKLPLKAGDKIEIKNHIPDFSEIRVKVKNNKFSILSGYDIEVKYMGDEASYANKIITTNRVIKEADNILKFLDVNYWEEDNDFQFGGARSKFSLFGFNMEAGTDSEAETFMASWPGGSNKLKGDFEISIKCNKRGWSFSDDGLTNIGIDFGAGANEEIKNYLTGLQQDMDSFIDRANTEIDNVPTITTATKQIYQQAPEPTAEPTAEPFIIRMPKLTKSREIKPIATYDNGVVLKFSDGSIEIDPTAIGNEITFTDDVYNLNNKVFLYKNLIINPTDNKADITIILGKNEDTLSIYPVIYLDELGRKDIEKREKTEVTFEDIILEEFYSDQIKQIDNIKIYKLEGDDIIFPPTEGVISVLVALD